MKLERAVRSVVLAVGLMRPRRRPRKRRASRRSSWRPRIMSTSILFTMKKDTPKAHSRRGDRRCHKMLARIDSVRTLKVGRPAAQDTPKLAKRNYDFALLASSITMPG